jgi:succinate dehydrogenase hydrophobic anchor subunit
MTVLLFTIWAIGFAFLTTVNPNSGTKQEVVDFFVNLLWPVSMAIALISMIFQGASRARGI